MSVSLLLTILIFFEKEAYEKTSTSFKILACIATFFELIADVFNIIEFLK